jgi:hypothetical protein
MVWISRSGKIIIMALVTIGVHQLVISVCMASLARESRMRAGERKMSRIMIERGWRPRSRIMARRAIMRECARNVIWICRAGERRAMALITISVD